MRWTAGEFVCFTDADISSSQDHGFPCTHIEEVVEPDTVCLPHCNTRQHESTTFLGEPGSLGSLNDPLIVDNLSPSVVDEDPVSWPPCPKRELHLDDFGPDRKERSHADDAHGSVDTKPSPLTTPIVLPPNAHSSLELAVSSLPAVLNLASNNTPAESTTPSFTCDLPATSKVESRPASRLAPLLLSRLRTTSAVPAADAPPATPTATDLLQHLTSAPEPGYPYAPHASFRPSIVSTKPITPIPTSFDPIDITSLLPPHDSTQPASRLLSLPLSTIPLRRTTFVSPGPTPAPRAHPRLPSPPPHLRAVPFLPTAWRHLSDAPDVGPFDADYAALWTRQFPGFHESVPPPVGPFSAKPPGSWQDEVRRAGTRTVVYQTGRHDRSW